MEIAKKNAGGTGVEVTWHDFRRRNVRHHNKINQKKNRAKICFLIMKLNEFGSVFVTNNKKSKKIEEKLIDFGSVFVSQKRTPKNKLN